MKASQLKRAPKELHQNCLHLLRDVSIVTHAIVRELYLCTKLELENEQRNASRQHDLESVVMSVDARPEAHARTGDVREPAGSAYRRSRISQYINERPVFEPSAW